MTSSLQQKKNIILLFSGEENNFEIGTNTNNSTMDTPYDYFSLLHYSKGAFSKGNESTIITKRPEFQDVIGQRLDMSHYDVEELNKFYGCSKYPYIGC